MTKYAVMFFSQRNQSRGDDGYAQDAQKMTDRVTTMPGYLGNYSARDCSGYGLTISYWQSQEAILSWRSESQHQEVQARGKEIYYDHYVVRRGLIREEKQYTSNHFFRLSKSVSLHEIKLPFCENIPESGTCMILISSRQKKDSLFKDELKRRLVNSPSLGLDYIDDNQVDQSIGVVYWLDYYAVQAWCEKNQDLFSNFNGTVQICDISLTRTYTSKVTAKL